MHIVNYQFMSGLIIFQSKYGATAQYAAWISEQLNWPAVSVADLDNGQLENADTVVLGTSIYIGKALIRKWIVRHLDLLHGKRVFLFIVCGTPTDRREELDKIQKNAVPGELQLHVSPFFFPGRMIYKNLSWKDRLLLQMGSRLMKKDGQKNILMDYDGMNKAVINPLVAAVQHQQAEEQFPPNGDSPLYKPGGPL